MTGYLEMSSPGRKRMRLSSPVYEGGITDFDADDLKELDRIELSLSQLARDSKLQADNFKRQSASLSEEAKQKRLQAILSALEADESSKLSVGDRTSFKTEHPGKRKYSKEELEFSQAPVEVGYQTKLVSDSETNYTSQPVVPQHMCEQSSSQEGPHEDSCSNWFSPSQVDPSTLPGFQRLSKAALISTVNLESTVSLIQDVSGPTTSGTEAKYPLNTGYSAWIAPSKDALALAEKKMREWSEEDEHLNENSELHHSQNNLDNDSNHSRPVLATIDNTTPAQSSASLSLTGQAHVSTPEPIRTKDKSKAFKVPLLANSTPNLLHPKTALLSARRSADDPNQALHVYAAPSVHATSKPMPISTSNAAIVHTPSSMRFSSPARNMIGTPRGNKRIHKNTFVTPFKVGMRPGEPGRATLESARRTLSSTRHQLQPNHATSIPNSTDVRTKRPTLKDSGLIPSRYSYDELESMGINVTDLHHITPKTAPFYSFYSSTSMLSKPVSTPISLGPDAALVHLLQKGCRLATREWVINHWSLILWKLAGLVCLDPSRESTQNPRWCWEEVLKQLEYRYEKEINRGIRPALRMITTQDAPSSAPMVLCISDIIHVTSGADSAVDITTKLDLEVTDGWYRLRAQVDETLTRAIRKGLLKVGRKIAVAGAKLNNQRREPIDILEVHESNSLQLFGNSTHLAPWHAKLGYQPHPFVSTLNKLTPDGGTVVLMNIIIEKVYPVAFLEYKEEKDGSRTCLGPHNEAEEANYNELWKNRRDVEEAKLRDELSARWYRWEGFADRLERAASHLFKPTEDEIPPDDIEDLFEDLDMLAPNDIGTFIRRLSYSKAGWLAKFIHTKIQRDKELATDEIESEMKHSCPVRDIRNFRVVVVRDAQIDRRPGNRRAQVTIWDVLNLCISEGGKAGAIEEDQHFLVTNLIPSQPKAWMGTDGDSTIYLSTRRDTKFIRLK